MMKDLYRIRIHQEALGIKRRVLGNGYVQLCNYMGNDETVVRCARQSYGKNNDDLSDKEIDKQIGEMMRKGHTSPFEQVVFQFHLRMPIFVARQWVRFRTARLNEISGRYTKFDKDDFYVPDENVGDNRYSYKNQEHVESMKNKIDDAVKDLIDKVKENNRRSYEDYSDLTDNKLPKELCRLTLPLTLMTEFYWQMDLHNLLHFLELRLEEHAQKEIREYALIIYKIVEMICPISIKHFKEYKFNAMTLGENDIKDLYDLLSSLPSHCFSSLSQDAEKPLISNRIYEMYRKIKDREEILKGPLPEAILL